MPRTELTLIMPQSGKVLIFIPGSRPDVPGHHVEVPASPDGWGIVLRLLRTRADRESAGLPPATLGEPEAPTQRLVDEWLGSHLARAKAEIQPRSPAPDNPPVLRTFSTQTLDDLGI